MKPCACVRMLRKQRWQANSEAWYNIAKVRATCQKITKEVSIVGLSLPSFAKWHTLTIVSLFVCAAGKQLKPINLAMITPPLAFAAWFVLYGIVKFKQERETCDSYENVRPGGARVDVLGCAYTLHLEKHTLEHPRREVCGRRPQTSTLCVQPPRWSNRKSIPERGHWTGVPLARTSSDKFLSKK